MTTWPATPEQLDVYLIDQMSNGSTGGSLAVDAGCLTADDVSRAATAVAEAHPVLQATFKMTRTGLECRTGPDAVPNHVVSQCVPCMPGSERDAAREYVHGRYGSTRWDLRGLPGIQHRLLAHGAGRATLVTAVHHIVFDGRSKFVYANAFEKALRGQALKPTSITQLEEDAGCAWTSADRGLHREQIERWARRSINAEAGANPGPDAAPKSLSMASTTLPAASSASVAAFAERLSVSRYTVFAAAVALATRAHLGSPFVLNVPVDTSTPKTSNRIGLQVNTVPVWLDAGEHEGLDAWVSRIQAGMVEVSQHRHLPIGELWRACGRPPNHDFVAVSYPRPPRQGQAPDLSWDFFSSNFGNPYGMAWQLRTDAREMWWRVDVDVNRITAKEASGMSKLVQTLLEETSRG